MSAEWVFDGDAQSVMRLSPDVALSEFYSLSDDTYQVDVWFGRANSLCPGEIRFTVGFFYSSKDARATVIAKAREMLTAALGALPGEP